MTVRAEAEQALRDGLEHHRAGDGETAAQCYRRALDAAPEYAEALHLMGVIELQAGHWNEAADWIEKAITINDTAPAYHDHLAVIHRNQGRVEDAEMGHRRALAIDPKFASAHNNLATTLRQAGRLSEALQSARRALEAAPKDPTIAVNAGTLFMETRAYASAAEAFAKAAEARPDSAAMHERLGVALFRAGRIETAETAFRNAVRLAPKSQNSRRWLVDVLLALERADEASEVARALVEDAPDDTELKATAGVAALRAGDLDGAEAIFEAALERDARCLPAIVGQAVISASRGRIAEAMAHYREVLAIDPDNVDAYGNLAMYGDDGLDAADADHLAGLLRRKDLPEDLRATVSFALAQYLERVGEADAAWDWYVTGNMLRRAHLRGVGHVFDAARHAGFVDARRRIFTPGFFAAREGFGNAGERPVFVVGLPRSGTTLVEHILAAHPAVFGAGELRDLPIMAVRRTQAMAGGEKPYPESVAELSAQQIDALAEDYLARLAVRAPDSAEHVIDKMPFNFLHLGLIHLMFPNARIVHCRRDVRDIGLSCFTINFTDAHPWTTDLGDIADYVNAYLRLMAHWRDVLPEGAMTEIDYEALVADQEGESRRLVQSVGLDWDPDCLEFQTSERVVTTASRAQVRRPIYASSVGRWRRREAVLGAMLDRLEGGTVGD